MVTTLIQINTMIRIVISALAGIFAFILLIKLIKNRHWFSFCIACLCIGLDSYLYLDGKFLGGVASIITYYITLLILIGILRFVGNFSTENTNLEAGGMKDEK